MGFGFNLHLPYVSEKGMVEESKLGSVIMGNDQTCEILGKGKIKLKLHDGTVRFLNEVQYIPKLKRNLISIGLLESKDFKIAMENGTLKVQHGALVVMIATRCRNMYFLKGSTIVGGTAIGEVTLDTIRLLEHANDNTLFESAKNCKFEVCEPCALEKQTKVKFGTIVHHTKGLLDYVHTNVWEPIHVASFGGRNYDVIFGGDMVIKHLHKFKCCLDLFGICNLN